AWLLLFSGKADTPRQRSYTARHSIFSDASSGLRIRIPSLLWVVWVGQLPRKAATTEAEKVERAAFEIERRVQGPEHQDTLISMNAIVAFCRGRAATARQRNWRAMSSVFSAAALSRSTPIHWLRWILCITSWSGRAATRKRRSHGSSSERFSAVSSARRTCKPPCLPITSLALQRTRGSAMRRSHSCAKPSITVYRPAWALASRVTLISNRFTATLASTPSSPTPKSMPQQPPSSSKRERERRQL